MTANPADAPRKFLFETTFEPGKDAARKKPAKAAPEPKFFDEDLARARAEGFSEGQETGRQEAQQGIERDAAQALSAIEGQLPALDQALTALREQQTRAAVEISAALVRKIFPRLARDHGLAEIETVAQEAITRLREEPRIAIRVADALLDKTKERVGALAAASGFEGRIVFLAEDGMGPGDVRIEWADGGAERDTARLWRDIEDIVRHMTGALKTPAGATAPAPQDAAAADTNA